MSETDTSVLPSTPSISPDYPGLVTYLVKPFLESPDSLKVDCEVSRSARILVRVAFEGEDKGRVFGRGGRNIQAVRTVLQAVAQAAGQVAHLEVFGGQPEREGGREGGSDDRRSAPRSQGDNARRPPRPRTR
ncbi:MAG: KH domain-containing protein [Oculatellaceae cyanobacterium Prado106]|nr:KH domain-containing protein [Oculatellaceae cyanobacterium Prado106]